MGLIETTQGEVVTRRFATRTEVQWDPATNGGTIIFYVERFTYLDGTLLSRVPENPVRGDLGALMERSFEVATGPETTMQVPGPLVMATMKKAFEELWEIANAPIPPIPEEEPAP